MLFTFVGGHGHFEPLVPIARAAADSRHTVAFGCAASMVPAVEAASLTGFRVGADPGGEPRRLPLRPPDRAREERDLRERFVRRAARYRVPHLTALCESFRPDLLVCDETDFGGLLAAERLGLPYASVQVIGSGSFVRPDVVGAALDELRAEHGLPPDPGLAMLSHYLVLSPFPRSYRDPAHPAPATTHGFRYPRPLQPSSGADGAWSRSRSGRAAVYFTLGTIFNLESGDLFDRVLAGLRELPVDVVVTVGHHVDPAELGPQPQNVRVERFVPQASLLPHCDLVVSHGGSGSVIGALAHGLPSVLIPLGADQPQNAERCAELGVARVLDAVTATPESVRDAAAGVLADAGYRRNAERLRDEIAALPEVAHAVALLERLAAERRPLVSA